MTTRLRSVAPRRPLAVALWLFLALLFVGVWLTVRALAAQDRLERAGGDLETARQALLAHDLPAAERAIERAGRDTERARELTSDPVWRAVAAVPGPARSLATAAGLVRGADDVARSVLPAALAGAQEADPEQLRGPDGALDIGRIQAAALPVTRSAQHADEVLAAVRELPAGAVGPVDRARGQLTGQLEDLVSGLRGASRALEVAPALLGSDRPRRYLLLVQQTSESRGTGGLIGGYVELEADRGRLAVRSSGSRQDLPNDRIPVPEGVPADFVDLYERLGGFDLWQNINLSPDLPTVARVVEARWQAQGGQPLDGVVTLDSKVLALLLQGAGPIRVGDGRVVTAEQLPEFLAVGQYVGIPSATTRQGQAGTRERRDQLASMAETAAGRLVSGEGSTVTLLRGMTDALRSGHLRMASDDPALETVLRDSGLDGRLPEGPAPVAYAVVSNASGSKLDHFLDRHLRYTAGPCRGERRRSTVEVELTNRAPAEGLPSYVTLRVSQDAVTQTTTGLDLLSVYGTPGSRLISARLNGRSVAGDDAEVPYLVSGTEAGLPVWRQLVELPPEQPQTLVLELDEPVVAGVPRVPEQPLARPFGRDVDVPVCR